MELLMSSYRADVCGNEVRVVALIAENQGQRGDDIATAAPDLHAHVWTLLKQTRFVGQKSIHKGERVITGLINIRVPRH
jgi:hypothetical protein